MTVKHFILPLALASMTGSAFAAAVSDASITVQSLTITADQAFVLSTGGGVVTADAGPDSSGDSDHQSLVISGPVSADASIATATAHADSLIPAFATGPATSVTLTGSIGASSHVGLSGLGNSQSLGVAGPLFVFRAAGASPADPVHLTLSMTIYGSIGGASDVPGGYASEVTAQFGYLSNGSPAPVAFFDLLLSGPPNAPLRILDPVTITGTAIIDSSGDVFFQALAEASSNATSAPEPLTLWLFGAGLLGLAAFAIRRSSR